MRIGILETGRVADDLVPRHGSYPHVFDRMIREADADFTTETYAVLEGALPDSPDACDGWLVTGSKHGVYDDLPWIAPLAGFLAEARATARPVVGVCFGHQILAKALGGAAEKSDRGWGVGLIRYAVHRKPGWMADAPDEMTFYAIHQDQVTAIPGDATVLASNDHCPYAMLAYGDPEKPDAISIQPHPEFTCAYLADLIDRRAEALGPEMTERARSTLGPEGSGAEFWRWATRYLKMMGAARQAA